MDEGVKVKKGRGITFASQHHHLHTHIFLSDRCYMGALWIVSRYLPTHARFMTGLELAVIPA